MRTARPWYRAQTDSWHVYLRGKLVPLAKGKRSKREANQAFCRLMANSPASSAPALRPTSLTVALLLDTFLDWVQQNLKTYDWYRRFLEDFAQSYGDLCVSDLRPLHATAWLAKKKTWGPTTRNKVIGTLKQAFNWAIEQGMIEANPLKGLKKPAARRRERILTAAEGKEILAAASDQAFRDFVLALQETGARPGEIRSITGKQVDLSSGVWVLMEHKTAKQTGRPRVIYLTDTMLELSRDLCEKHPEGPIFRNRFQKPWSRNAIRMRFRNLRKKLPHLKGVVAYCYRHTFATDGLERGVPIATMAELLGHTSTAMLSAHYGHLSEKGTHLRQAVARATGKL